ALDAFREETDKATASMLNVPAGFRLQQRWFESILPEVGPPVVPQPQRVTRDSLFPSPADTRGQPTGQPVLTGGDVYHFHAPIQIDARERPAGEIFDVVVDESRRRARGIGGTLASPTIALGQ